MTVLRGEGLTCALGGRPVLEDVTVQVPPGEVLGIVGPNGAGKTTLLRALAGLQAVSGAIFYGETPLKVLTARQRAQKRAYVGQPGAAGLPYRVHEVVGMGLAHTDWLYRAPSRPKNVAHALAEVQCAVDPERRFDRLSGGERQQVLLARALIQKAPLLLLDEPVSALDLRHQAAVLAAVRRLAQGGGAVVVSLHDLNLAALMCDRLLLLRGGRVCGQGTPRQMFTPALLQEVYEVPLRISLDPYPTVSLVG